RSPNETETAGAAVAEVGRREAWGGAEAAVRAAECSASAAGGISQGRAAYHAAAPSRGVEPADAPLLPRPPARLRDGLPAVRVPPDRVLGAGEPHPPRGRGARRRRPRPGDEG